MIHLSAADILAPGFGPTGFLYAAGVTGPTVRFARPGSTPGARTGFKDSSLLESDELLVRVVNHVSFIAKNTKLRAYLSMP